MRNYNFQKKNQVMGILNVTPDSFSDGGNFQEVNEALKHAESLLEAGCDIIDIGGQSTRPGYVEVSFQEELQRVLPVVTELRKKTTATISVDTYFPEVAEAVLKAGADIINDISGLENPAMIEVLKKFPKSGIIVMDKNKHEDLKSGLKDFFQKKTTSLKNAGISFERICLDPGVGFGKTLEQNISLIQSPQKYRFENYPVLYGISRKRTIGSLVNESDAKKRDYGSVTASLWLLNHGVEIVRVHEAYGMKQAVTMWGKLNEK